MDAILKKQQEKEWEIAFRTVLREELVNLDLQPAAKSKAPQQALDFLASL